MVGLKDDNEESLSSCLDIRTWLAMSTFEGPELPCKT